MSVDLSPEELGFRRPFSHEVTQTLRITNRESTPIAFKVKTTAPKQYCVRPNSGIVPVGSNVEVQVLLQAMKEEPPLEAKCRDKFLVQTVKVVDDVDEANVAAVWSNIEKSDKSMIQDKKIKVSFLPAAGGSTGMTNGTSAAEEPSSYAPSTPAYGSPVHPSLANTDVRTPQSQSQSQSAYSSVTMGGDNARSINTGTPATGTSASPRTNAPSSSTSTNNTSDATGIAGMAAAVSNSIPRSQQELQDQLSAAQSRIMELTNQLSDPQVRQRKVAEAQEKVSTVMQQTQETGVPLHITAALCLVSFLIAWLFF